MGHAAWVVARSHPIVALPVPPRNRQHHRRDLLRPIPHPVSPSGSDTGSRGLAMKRLYRLADPYRHIDRPPPQGLLNFYVWCLEGSLPLILLGVGLNMLAGSFEVFAALILGLVIDGTIGSSPDRLFVDNRVLIVGAVLFFVIIRPIAFGASSMVTSMMIGPNLSAQVLARLHRHTMLQSVSFFDDDFAGRISQKQLQASRAVTETVVEFVNAISFAAASLIGSFLLLASINIRVGFALVAWLLLYIGLIRWFLPRIRTRAAARAGARSNLSGQIVDTITNIRTVKLFAHHHFEDRAALDALEGFREKAMAFGQVASVFRFFLMLLSGALPVLLVGAAMVLWTQGVASAGDIAATGSVAIRIAQMSGWISFVMMGIYSNVGEAEDGMRTLAHPHQMADRPGAAPLRSVRGTISYEGVSFSYGRPIGGVRDITISIKAGEHVGLVGASGAGKSTLASLLMRLYDPDSGIIRIDGRDLRTLTQESLRRQISMVTQETAMFNRSAYDNIAYGRPDATRAAVTEAARQAEAHAFILDLADQAGRTGYEAHLGERGVKLSGGQRQRIALARAVLKDAPILILDEATSALDSTVEASIQHALQAVMTGKTVVAIAHRLSTITRMDRILVLQDGTVIEQGDVDTLLAMGGVFCQHWDRQVGGLIGMDGSTPEIKDPPAVMPVGFRQAS